MKVRKWSCDMLEWGVKKHNFKMPKTLLMPVPFTIKVTKEILELSRNCGRNEIEIIGKIAQLLWR